MTPPLTSPFRIGDEPETAAQIRSGGGPLTSSGHGNNGPRHGNNGPRHENNGLRHGNSVLFGLLIVLFLFRWGVEQEQS